MKNKFVFRQGVFETNSSSMHSISLGKNTDDTTETVANLHSLYPNGVYQINSLCLEEYFGWEYEEYIDFDTKMQYFLSDVAKETTKIDNEVHSVLKQFTREEIKSNSYLERLSKNNASKNVFLVIDKEHGEWLDKLFEEYIGLKYDLSKFTRSELCPASYGTIDCELKSDTLEESVANFVNFMLSKNSALITDNDNH